MQAADVARPHRASGAEAAPAVAAHSPQHGGYAGGPFQAQAVVPARLAPPPTSPLGLAGYRGAGPDLWFSSCHGGAGVSTLTALIPRSMSAGRYWPMPVPPVSARVLLVARSHAAGLCAAQAAARQWAAGVLPNVRLLGLVVVADAPGKRPKPLSDLVRLISGGVPRLWELPWVEALRIGDPPDQARLPSAYSRLANDLHHIVSEDAHV
ncbi:DUF6668 family protein [Actinoallomurus sp. CA-142502]|jgi:hypothetical protein|uniref:DUF6668 family protein n=1 Tax=Actinoallomurus sp. CA-142502 TaxID=3239885 RepID=UPI003D94D517